MKASTVYILGLIESFPCLSRKLSHWHPTEFDPDKLMAMTDCWSSGERMCALFVVNVWNPGYAKSKGWTFNLFDFMGTADGGNAAAVRDWVAAPYFP